MKFLPLYRESCKNLIAPSNAGQNAPDFQKSTRELNSRRATLLPTRGDSYLASLDQKSLPRDSELLREVEQHLKESEAQCHEFKTVIEQQNVHLAQQHQVIEHQKALIKEKGLLYLMADAQIESFSQTGMKPQPEAPIDSQVSELKDQLLKSRGYLAQLHADIAKKSEKIEQLERQLTELNTPRTADDSVVLENNSFSPADRYEFSRAQELLIKVQNLEYELDMCRKESSQKNLELESKLEAAKASLTACAAENSSVSSRLVESLQKIESLQAELAEKNAQLQRATNTLEENRSKLESVFQVMQKETQSAAEINRQKEEMSREVHEYQCKMSDIEGNFERTRGSLERTRQECADLRAKLGAAEGALKSEFNLRQRLSNLLDAEKEEKSETLSRLEIALENLSRERDAHSFTSSTLNALKSEFDGLSGILLNERETHKAEIDSLRSELELRASGHEQEKEAHLKTSESIQMLNVALVNERTLQQNLKEKLQTAQQSIITLESSLKKVEQELNDTVTQHEKLVELHKIEMKEHETCRADLESARSNSTSRQVAESNAANLEGELSMAQQKLSEERALHESTKSSLKQHLQSISKLEEECKFLNESLVAEKKSKDEALIKMETYRQDVSMHLETISKLKEECKSLGESLSLEKRSREEKLEILSKDISMHLETISKLREECKSLNALVTLQNSSLAETQINMDSLSKENSLNIETIANLENESKSLKNSMATLQDSLAASQIKLDSLNAEKSSLLGTISNLEKDKEITAESSISLELQKEIEILQSSKNDLIQKFDDIKCSNVNLETRITSLLEEVDRLRADLAIAEKERDSLKSSVAAAPVIAPRGSSKEDEDQLTQLMLKNMELTETIAEMERKLKGSSSAAGSGWW